MYRDFVDIPSPNAAGTLWKFGFNSDVGTGEETVWEEGGVYAYPAAATVLKVSSASTDDDANPEGTGAHTVKLYGQDANYDEIEETVTLDGQSQVDTTNEFLRIYRMKVMTAGSGNKNAGIVYAGTGSPTNGKPATVYAHMGAGFNQTLMGLYTVPNNRWFYLTSLFCSTASTASDRSADFRLYAREQGGLFQLKDRFLLIKGSTQIDHSDAPIAFPPKTDIEIRCVGSAAVDASAGFSGILT